MLGWWPTEAVTTIRPISIRPSRASSRRRCRRSRRRVACASSGACTAGPCSVNELAAAVGMEPSAVSHQLRLLRHLGLVVGHREGRRVVYDLYDDHVGELLEQAISHVEHLRAGLGRAPWRARRRAAHEAPSRARAPHEAVADHLATTARTGDHGHGHGLVDPSISDPRPGCASSSSRWSCSVSPPRPRPRSTSPPAASRCWPTSSTTPATR